VASTVPRGKHVETKANVPRGGDGHRDHGEKTRSQVLRKRKGKKNFRRSRVKKRERLKFLKKRWERELETFTCGKRRGKRGDVRLYLSRDIKNGGQA